MMSAELINTIGSVLVVILFSFIFIVWGSCLTNRFLKNKINDQLALSMGYFLGATSFISLWCYLELLTRNALLSLGIATVSFIAFILLNLSYFKFNIFKQFLKVNLATILVFTVISILFFFARIYPINFNIDAHLGSGSTQLYFNKTLFYYKNNIIPRSTNSIGQSLLAAIPLFFGFTKSGILNLFIWLYVSLSFFTLFIYGFLKEIKFSKRECLLGTFFLLFGNFSFSLLPIWVIDTGMPLILVNYAHSVITLSTFLTFLLLYYFYIKNTLEINLSFIVLTILVLTSWFITSPENVVIGVPLFIILTGLRYRARQINFKIVLTLLIFIMVISLLGMSRGGLLSPAFFRDIEIEKNIPGYQVSPVGVPISFKRPGLDYGINFALDIASFQYPSGRRFHTHPNEREQEAIIPFTFAGSFSNRYVNKLSGSGFAHKVASILLAEFEFWNALRILFIPIVGIVTLLIISHKNENEILMRLSSAAGLAFLGGFILAFFPYQDGIKWPFTRFLLPGAIPAQLCFYIAALLIINKLNFAKPKKVIVKIALILILSGGQVLGLLTNSAVNIASKNKNEEDVLTRAMRMVSTDDYVR